MAMISSIFTGLACLLHFYFFILETFLWTKPVGLKVFKMNLEKANSSKVLAANQGVYNAMLALGLLVSFFIPDADSSMALRIYCLSFIVIVGIYGWYSLKSFKVFIIQSLPALIALTFALVQNTSH